MTKEEKGPGFNVFYRFNWARQIVNLARLIQHHQVCGRSVWHHIADKILVLEIQISFIATQNSRSYPREKNSTRGSELEVTELGRQSHQDRGWLV